MPSSVSVGARDLSANGLARRPRAARSRTWPCGRASRRAPGRGSIARNHSAHVGCPHPRAGERREHRVADPDPDSGARVGDRQVVDLVVARDGRSSCSALALPIAAGYPVARGCLECGGELRLAAGGGPVELGRQRGREPPADGRALRDPGLEQVASVDLEAARGAAARATRERRLAGPSAPASATGSAAAPAAARGDLGGRRRARSASATLRRPRRRGRDRVAVDRPRTRAESSSSPSSGAGDARGRPARVTRRSRRALVRRAASDRAGGRAPASVSPKRGSIARSTPSSRSARSAAIGSGSRASSRSSAPIRGPDTVLSASLGHRRARELERVRLDREPQAARVPGQPQQPRRVVDEAPVVEDPAGASALEVLERARRGRELAGRGPAKRAWRAR